MNNNEIYDLISIGRVGVDLYPLEIGKTLSEVTSFGKFLGGSPTNVAVAAAKHGLKSAVITQVGQDAFGEFVRLEIKKLGVDNKYVNKLEGLKTPITFCEIFPPDNFPLYFYREPVAPDLLIEKETIDFDAISKTQIFWISLTGLSHPVSAETHVEALKQRKEQNSSTNKYTILDLDYRSMFWESEKAAKKATEKILPYVNITVGNLEECRVAVGEKDAEKAAEALLDRGIEIAVIKQGPEGVLVKTKNETLEVSSYKVKVLNGLGAGDGFGGAMCYGLLNGFSIKKTIEFANVAGAIVASRLECSTAMPSTEEVLHHLGEWGKNEHK